MIDTDMGIKLSKLQVRTELMHKNNCLIEIYCVEIILFTLNHISI